MLGGRRRGIEAVDSCFVGGYFKENNTSCQSTKEGQGLRVSERGSSDGGRREVIISYQIKICAAGAISGLATERGSSAPPPSSITCSSLRYGGYVKIIPR